MNPCDVTVVLYDDGTKVADDSYLKQLPHHTVLVFLRPRETFGAGKQKVFLLKTRNGFTISPVYPSVRIGGK